MKHLLVIGLLMAVSTLGVVVWSSRKRDSRLVRCLKRRFPHAKIELSNDELTLRVGSAIVRVDQAGADPLEDERHLIHLYAEVERALRREPMGNVELKKLVPVPLPPQRTERVDQNARFVVALHPELEIGFAVHSTSTGQWLTLQDALELDAKKVLRSALSHLHQNTDGATVYRDGPLGAELYLVRQDDGLDAARLLLAPLWDTVSKMTGAPLVLATPTRDRIYAAPVDQPKSLERLFERVREDWDSRAHPLSTRIWVWQDDRLQPWHLHA